MTNLTPSSTDHLSYQYSLLVPKPQGLTEPSTLSYCTSITKNTTPTLPPRPQSLKSRTPLKHSLATCSASSLSRLQSICTLILSLHTFFCGSLRLYRATQGALSCWETTLDRNSRPQSYNLPWFPFNYFENVLGGAERHDYHHSVNYMNYGSLTKFVSVFQGGEI
jgi:hypothetical protein